MKKLILIVSFLFFSTGVLAESDTPKPVVKIMQLPTVIQCFSTSLTDMLENRFGELEALEGEGTLVKPDNESVSGDFKMYIDPGNDKSFTVTIKFGDFECIVLSGGKLTPITGQKL